ncbi:hypothetical protein ACFV3R_08800 [Streptomyces sp. NPDC059740]|uniref:hypothetical protein n=1 Tax=Streptomyces sp. NPDC059740 TaxID=3346926 RepID=UPI00365A6CA7
MAKDDRSRSHPQHGEGATPHKGTGQHGWSPDVDTTRKQDNPSAERSFAPDEHAPEPGSGRTPAREERSGVPGEEVRSDSRRGEERAARNKEEGRRGKGAHGRSQRPSGHKDAESYTGVDPRGSDTGRRAG